MGRAAAPGPLPPAHEPRPLRAPGPRGCAPGRAGLAPCRGRSSRPASSAAGLLPLRAAAAAGPPSSPPAATSPRPHHGKGHRARGTAAHGGRRRGRTEEGGERGQQSQVGAGEGLGGAAPRPGGLPQRSAPTSLLRPWPSPPPGHCHVLGAQILLQTCVFSSSTPVSDAHAHSVLTTFPGRLPDLGTEPEAQRSFTLALL